MNNKKHSFQLEYHIVKTKCKTNEQQKAFIPIRIPYKTECKTNEQQKAFIPIRMNNKKHSFQLEYHIVKTKCKTNEQQKAFIPIRIPYCEN